MYARRLAGREYTFGVSGLLYRSNVLMYDRQTESLWLQVKREAVAGPMTGTRLDAVPSTVTTWAKWRKAHPRTQVLSMNTGYERDYGRDPYETYYRSRRGLFSRFFTPAPGPEEKELVVGAVINGRARAYPLRLLRKERRLEETFAGAKVEVTLGEATDAVAVSTHGGAGPVPVVVYWFVWKGIHPATTVYGDGSE